MQEQLTDSGGRVLYNYNKEQSERVSDHTSQRWQTISLSFSPPANLFIIIVSLCSLVSRGRPLHGSREAAQTARNTATSKQPGTVRAAILFHYTHAHDAQKEVEFLLHDIINSRPIHIPLLNLDKNNSMKLLRT